MISHHNDVEMASVSKCLSRKRIMKCGKRQSPYMTSICKRSKRFHFGTVVNERFLASGSFGKIYTATLVTHWCTRRVAIKKIPMAENGHENALKEAEILRKIRHTNIVTIHDIISNFHEGELWIIMEYLNGGSLRSYCTGDSHLDFHEKLKVSCDCWSALSYLHIEAKITHKDIKPENILLHKHPTGHVTAKLCDFGLATMTDQLTTTQLTSITGTAMYFPPEYVESIRNPEKADVYSMGASLCELYSRCYFWCHPETNDPLTYPQIIGKLLTIWKQLKRGSVKEPNIPCCVRKIECLEWTQIQDWLSSAVCLDRHGRPSAETLRDQFLVLWKTEMSKVCMDIDPQRSCYLIMKFKISLKNH